MAGSFQAQACSLERRRSSRVLILAATALCIHWGLPTAQSGRALAQVPAPFEDPGLGHKIAAGVKDHAMKAAALVYLVCFLVAKTEPPPPKVAPAATPLEKRGDFTQVLLMSSFLSLLSGIVNAIAIIEMGGTVAHHTGNASHTGRLLGTDAARFFALMVAYLVGAGLAGYCKSDGEALYCGKYSPGLLSAAIAVAGGAVIEWLTGSKLVALPILSFSQGLQNAISRRCASLPVCTTHMTGYLTDAGMGLGTWGAGGCRGAVPTKTKFFLLSIFAFIAGGLVAKQLLDAAGILVASMVPAGLMAVAALGLIPTGAGKK